MPSKKINNKTKAKIYEKEARRYGNKYANKFKPNSNHKQKSKERSYDSFDSEF